MAVLANRTSGNFTSSSTWALVENSTWQNILALQESGTTATTTTYQTGTVFTVPTTQTIQGVLLKVQSRVLTAGNTLTARIFNATGSVEVANSVVTIDVSDIPNGNGWFFLKFPANVTLNTAINYRIDILSNTTGAATLYRKTATVANWTFGLVTSTQQAPAVTDQLLIVGENSAVGVSQTFTVTVDNTATTVFGPNVVGASAIEVNAKGILSYSTAVSTNTQLNLDGNLIVNQDAIFRMGTSASPIPSTSTASLIFDVVSNIQYGLQHRLGGIITTYGASKTTKTTLSTIAGPGSISLSTVDSTAWASGDVIALAPTVRGSIGQAETVTLSGPAVGTSVPVSATSFLHDGNASANNARACVLNLTRNVVIRGTSTLLQTYFVTAATGSISCNFTSFQYFGSNNATTRGIEGNITSGTFEFIGCAFSNFEVAGSTGILLNSATSIANVQNCVFYRQAALAVGMTAVVTLTGNTVTVNNCSAIGGTSMGTVALYNFTANAGTYTDLMGSASFVSAFIFQSTAAAPSLTISNLYAYNCTSSNIQINVISELTQSDVLLTNIVSYRSAVDGIAMGSSVTGACINTIINGGRLFGNTTRGLTAGFVYSSDVKNMLIYNEAGYDQPVGIAFNNHTHNLYFDTCQIGVALAHSTSDVRDVCPRNEHIGIFRNCIFGSTTEFSNLSNFTPQSYQGSAKHDQVAGVHKMYKKYGIITSDTTLFKVASPSQRLTPSDVTNKLYSQEKKIAIPTGQGATVSVWVRKSVIGDGATYNGNEVQIILLADPALGIASNTVIATSSAFSNGDFELITGSIPAITDNGVVRLIAACDGTSGWVNIDLWGVTLV